jgi:transcriptional regulator with XRE-family HTH domain
METATKIRIRLREVARLSGLTQQEIGEKMGMTPKDARKAVSRLLNPGIKYDPRISTLIAFAEAVGVDLRDII